MFCRDVARNVSTFCIGSTSVPVLYFSFKTASPDDVKI